MCQDVKKKIEEIVGHLKCPKDFKCCQSGIEILCRAKMVDGTATYLECLEQDPRRCVFSNFVSDNESGFYICACPLRRYIADQKSDK
jgi:hypothetical protein